MHSYSLFASASSKGGAATLARHGPAHYRRMVQRRIGVTRFLPGLRDARSARGLTVAALAALAGLHVNTVSHLEQGHTPARPRTVGKLVRALRVPPAVLFEAPTQRTAEGLRRGA